MATHAEYVEAFEQIGFDAATARRGADLVENGPYFGFVDVAGSLARRSQDGQAVARANFIMERARLVVRRLEPKGPTFMGRLISEVKADAERRALAEEKATEQRRTAVEERRQKRAQGDAAGDAALDRIDRALGLKRG